MQFLKIFRRVKRAVEKFSDYSLPADKHTSHKKLYVICFLCFSYFWIYLLFYFLGWYLRTSAFFGRNRAYSYASEPGKCHDATHCLYHFVGWEKRVDTRVVRRNGWTFLFHFKRWICRRSRRSESKLNFLVHSIIKSLLNLRILFS